MAKGDLYAILGVSRGASADEVRGAYRKLARQYHPDVNKAAGAAAKFNEVQEAYEVLSDPEKRAYYDRHGVTPGSQTIPQGAGESGRGPGAAPGGGFDFDLDDLGSVFEAVFGGRENPFPNSGKTGAKSGRRRAQPRSAETQSDQDAMRHEVDIPFQTALRGGSVSLKLAIGGRTRTIDVKVPPGIESGSSLRVRGGAGHGQDVILKIKVAPDPLFRRAMPHEGSALDLFFELPLNVSEAILGATVSVPTPDEPVELTVPGGTASGTKLRLKGRGIENAAGEKGDLYAVVRIVPPRGAELAEDEREVIARLGRKMPELRAGPGWDR